MLEIEKMVSHREINQAALEKLVSDFVAFMESLLRLEKITQTQYGELVDRKLEFLKGCRQQNESCAILYQGSKRIYNEE